MEKKKKIEKKTRNMSWLYERERERNFWIFCARAHKSEKKLRSRSRSPPDESELGAPLKWAALTKALDLKQSVFTLKKYFNVDKNIMLILLCQAFLFLL